MCECEVWKTLDTEIIITIMKTEMALVYNVVTTSDSFRLSIQEYERRFVSSYQRGGSWFMAQRNLIVVVTRTKETRTFPKSEEVSNTQLHIEPSDHFQTFRLPTASDTR